MPDKSLSWVKEIEIEDLLDKDAKLVYENCGLDTCAIAKRATHGAPTEENAHPHRDEHDNYTIR